MSQEVYVGVDLAKDIHQVMAVGSDHQVLASTFRMSQGRGGVKEMIERLRFLMRQESDLVFSFEAPRLGLQPEDLLLEVGLQLDEIGSLEKQIVQLGGRIDELYGEVDSA